ncbi:MAG: SCP2 sterol-binding domain-containing protein [Endozoicomonas sp.]
MATVQEVLAQLNDRYDADAAAGQTMVIQFDLTDADTYHLDIKNGALNVAEGANDSPDVVLIMDSETFVGIMTGEVNGMQAFMTGKLRTEGNMMLASKLGEFFKE